MESSSAAWRASRRSMRGASGRTWRSHRERALVDRRGQSRRDREPPAPHVRVHDLGRTEADRPHAGPLRPEPRRAVRAPATDRRSRQAHPQGELLSGDRGRLPLHHRTGGLCHNCARGVQRHPLRGGLARLAVRHLGRDRERADLADPDLRAQLARDLRLHRRRVCLGLEVLSPRVDAHVRPARLLRGRARSLSARRRPHGGLALARRHRRQAAGDDLVRRAAGRGAARLLRRRHGRDEPASLRPPGSRHGARPHRHLHLAAGDAAAPSLRPADGLRLEDPPAGGDAERARHRGAGDRRMSPQPLDSFRGFGVTLRQIFKKPITQQYPEYKRPVYPRFRGRHRLWRHTNGLEKCVGCSLCAAACPAYCIRVVAAENTAENRISAGERYARIYEINLSRCIFCGYCELACPFDALTLEAEYELSEYSRDDLIYTKDMLLTEPIKRMPVADRDLYDTPIPAYKARS